MANQEQDEELRARLNRETARIAWSELQRFFASGMVLAVKPGLDLVDVAVRLVEDDKHAVSTWLDDRSLFPPDDALACRWLKEEVVVWAVVVAPWVLVQLPVEESSHD